MSLRTIVQALGGELYDGGRRANIPAPGHSAADRSVSLLLRRPPGRGTRRWVSPGSCPA